MVGALASHQCGLGLIPGLSIISELSSLLVLVLAPRVFSLGTPVFPSPQKTSIFKFQFDLDYSQAFHNEPLVREIAKALPILLTLNKLLYFTEIQDFPY